jgi:hypothetical protein
VKQHIGGVLFPQTRDQRAIFVGIRQDLLPIVLDQNFDELVRYVAEPELTQSRIEFGTSYSREYVEMNLHLSSSGLAVGFGPSVREDRGSGKRLHRTPQ